MIIDPDLEKILRPNWTTNDPISTTTNEPRRMNNFARFLNDICKLVKIQFRIK